MVKSPLELVKPRFLLLASPSSWLSHGPSLPERRHPPGTQRPQRTLRTRRRWRGATSRCFDVRERRPRRCSVLGGFPKGSEFTKNIKRWIWCPIVGEVLVNSSVNSSVNYRCMPPFMNIRDITTGWFMSPCNAVNPTIKFVAFGDDFFVGL